MKTDPREQRERDVARPWRVVLLFYALALTLGTHWPKLEIDLPQLPSPDKILHLLAFGGLTVLVWRARLIRGWWLPSIMLAWTLFDEMTQALPVLGRRFSMLDVTAGWLGVLVATAWIGALAPLGGEANRRRLAVSEFAVEQVFLRFRNWILIGLAGLGMAATIGALAGLMMWFAHPDGMVSAAAGGFLAGGIGGAYGLLDALWRKEHARATAERRCMTCGASCAEAPVDHQGHGRCAECGEPFHLGQWIAHADLSRSTLVRLGTRAGLHALGFGLLLAALYVTIVALYIRSATVRQMVSGFGRVPVDMRFVVDTALLGAILALVARLFRRRMAAIIDRQGATCRACGHDVHATQTERGIGRCPECGTPFMRVEQAKATNAESAKANGVDG